MSNQATPAGTDQPATIRVGSRTVEVDGSPLRAWSANFRTTTLAEPGAGCLELRPSWGARLFGVVFALFGVVPLLIAYLDPPEEQTDFLMVLGFGAVFVVSGLLILLLFSYRARFDLGSGQLTHGCLGFRQAQPLAEVLAVQLIFGGIHDGDDTCYASYQLNLVLDDPGRPRLCLTNHANLSWTRWAAARLADFLDVPLLDQIPPGK